MTIRFDKDMYVHGIWFCECELANWLCALIRPDGEPWKVKYRFRYFLDGKAFDSADEKHWYEYQAEPDDDLEDVLEKLSFMMNAIRTHFKQEPTFEKLECRGDDIKVVETFLRLGFPSQLQDTRQLKFNFLARDKETPHV